MCQECPKEIIIQDLQDKVGFLLQTMQVLCRELERIKEMKTKDAFEPFIPRTSVGQCRVGFLVLTKIPQGEFRFLPVQVSDYTLFRFIMRKLTEKR